MNEDLAPLRAFNSNQKSDSDHSGDEEPAQFTKKKRTLSDGMKELETRSFQQEAGESEKQSDDQESAEEAQRATEALINQMLLEEQEEQRKH